MTAASYQETISWLFEQFPSYQNIGAGAYKPDLGNINALLDELNISLYQVPYVHVAGTNGKGSTCSIIASVLTEAGYKVGLFTSPHIVDFRERIRINGEMIDPNDVVAFVEQLTARKLTITPSFFEISFAMAIHHFNKQQCDIAIIETGLGGRLDATNCITPLVSVITNIGLEHQNFLGNTRAKIAFEKAGIIKPHIPVVVGQLDAEIQPVFEAKVTSTASPMIPAISDHHHYFQRNIVLAKCALALLRDQYYDWTEADFTLGLAQLHANTGLRARFQQIGDDPVILIDAAHNVDGIAALFKSVQIEYPNRQLHIVYGTSNDKNVSEIGKLFPPDAIYYFVQFRNQRAMKLEELQLFAQELRLNASFYSDTPTALNVAKNTANQDDLILVFGSFFLLEEIF
jgi:dihydrofolate synthase / folylpolyglutamate synthase